MSALSMLIKCGNLPNVSYAIQDLGQSSQCKLMLHVVEHLPLVHIRERGGQGECNMIDINSSRSVEFDGSDPEKMWLGALQHAGTQPRLWLTFRASTLTTKAAFSLPSLARQ